MAWHSPLCPGGFRSTLLARVMADRKGVTAMEYGVIAAGMVLGLPLLLPRWATTFPPSSPASMPRSDQQRSRRPLGLRRSILAPISELRCPAGC
jgi:hypothetical protein